MNKKNAISLLLVSMLFISLVSDSYLAVEIACCLTFILSTLCVNRKDGFSIFSIFLVTVFLFCFDVVFGDLFGIYDLHSFDHFGRVLTLSDKELILSMKTLNFFLSGITFAWLFKGNIHKQSSFEDRIYYPRPVKKILIVLFYILFIPEIFVKLILVYSSFVYGYVESVHVGELISVNNYVYYAASLYSVTSIFCLYLADTKKEFVRIAVVYAIPNILLFATGQRGPGIVTILIILWLYNAYVGRIKSKSIILFAVLCVVFMPLIGMWRGDVSELEYNNVFDWTAGFFFGQGQSFNVIPLTARHLNDFTNNVPFFLGYFTDFFKVIDNYSMDAITQKSYLAFHLAYWVYGDVFFLGHTLGTSLIAELFELVNGYYILIFPFSYLIMKVAIYFSKNIYKNAFVFIIGFNYLMNFFYSPRDSIGKVITVTLIYTLIYVVIINIFTSGSIKRRYSKGV